MAVDAWLKSLTLISVIGFTSRGINSQNMALSMSCLSRRRAGQQFNFGDSGQASETLNLVRRYAEKIRMGVADDSKKTTRCRIAYAAHILST